MLLRPGDEDTSHTVGGVASSGRIDFKSGEWNASLIRDALGLIKPLRLSPKQTLGTTYLTSD